MTKNMLYPIIEVPSDRPDMDEQLGTKPKFWFRDENDNYVLFKQGREGTGENWAEKVVCEIAELLGIPHAYYDLAVWRGHQGIVTRKFFPAEHILVFANELITRPKDERDKKYLNEDHNIDVIMRYLAIDSITIPMQPSLRGLKKPNELFLAYLMLDTLVGNTDRHDENWGILLTDGVPELASTFDHASSLGRELSDDMRMRRLETTDPNFSIESYALRADSALFRRIKNKPKKLKTLEAFHAASEYAPHATERWLGELERVINKSSIEKILDAVPEEFMSNISKDFALRLIIANKIRLLREN